MIALVRYGIPAAFVIAGFVILIVRRDATGVEGWAMLVGAGIAVFLFNLFYRIGASGDEERVAEERAREYMAEHGHWPDERPPGGL